MTPLHRGFATFSAENVQPDEFWAEEGSAKERLGKLSEGLLENLGGSL